MIKLTTPITSFWHPQGDKDGNPLKVQVDHAQIVCVREDSGAKRLEIAIQHGYISGGKFTHVAEPNRCQVIPTFTISDNDPKNPKVTAYSDFLASVAKKGAPVGDFRRADIEQLLIDGGFVAGAIASS